MMQGDEYGIPVEITTDSGPADGSTFADVEIFIGRIRKTLATGQIKFSEQEKAFMFPLTQEETMLLSKGMQPVQIRVKTASSGDVIGCQLPDIDVLASVSKVVL